MKTIKLTIALLIAILFVLPGAGFAQQIDKKSEDAKKAESGISTQEKEKQEQTDQSTFSTKDNDEKKEKKDQKTVKQTKKKKSKEGDPQFGTEDKTREQPPTKEVEDGTVEKEEGTGYHTLKEDQAKESSSGVAPGDTKEKAPPKETPPAKETPPGKVKEKTHTSRGASDYAPGHVKKGDVEEAKEKAQISVKNTENAVLSTEQRIAVAKEKIEDVRLRLDEKMKAGTITEQEYHEKMVRISQAEERLINLELEMNADKEKINQTKKFID